MSLDHGFLQPAGWAIATLSDLVGAGGFITDGDWVESEDQDARGEVRLTQLADVGDGQFRDRSNRYLTRIRADELHCTYLEAGDVLIARMPDPLGRACLFPGSPRPCVTAVDVCIARLGKSAASNRWLMHTINSPRFRTAVSGLQSGSTRKRISKKNLLTIRLPVPPAPEQIRMADAVDSYFTRLDDAVASLKRVQANLKRYRASVLKAAVEGRLVSTEAELARKEGRDYEHASVLLDHILVERRRRWEEAELVKLKANGKAPTDDRWQKKYDEPVGPGASRSPELPEGWRWATLDQLLAEPLANGRSVKTADGGFPVLRLTALRGEVVDLGERKQGAWSSETAKPFLVKAGDFFIARGNGSIRLVGRGALVEQEPDPVAFPDTLIRVRMVESLIEPRFVARVWHSEYVRAQIERSAKTTAGIFKVNQTDLARCILPVPPLAEQHRILQQLDRQLSVAASAEAEVAAGIKRGGQLRQAILALAFAGKLVDQDPNDEPASVLLEHIGAERAVKPKAKTRDRRIKVKAA